MDGTHVVYVGEFYFLRWKFKIVGMWDDVDGILKQRLNFFVDRLPREQQTIINGINKMRRQSNG